MKKFENYPRWIISITIILQLAIYVIGGAIIYQFGLVWLIVYLIYVAYLEITFYPKSCVYCYYYGKWCAFGKGKMAAWLGFKQKDNKKFCERQATYIGMIPEMLVVIVPVFLGIVLLLQRFEWGVLALIIIDLILVSWGNGFVRSKLACAHCKQGEICCPAREMFEKKAK